MRILIWHLRRSWLTAFVQGTHEYLVPVTPDRGPYGLGRAHTWDWPSSVREVSPELIRSAGVDLVILQRPEEHALAAEWLGQVPGTDLPVVYLEHHPPPGPVTLTRHPMAGVPGMRIVHVSHFNAVHWDCGRTPTTVIEHGIPDPGARWTGDIEHAGVVVNHPVRWGRTAGADLLPGFAEAAPLDLFGMGVTGFAGSAGIPAWRCREFENLPHDQMLTELARRRIYIHPFRWASLGLSLIEAMHLAMPVVALAATEAPTIVPPQAGCVSASPSELHDAIRRFLRDRQAAAVAGAVAREAACARFGLKRFLDDWDHVLREARGC